MKVKLTYPAVLTGLFCGFLGVGTLTGVFFPKKAFSETENRYLASAPKFTWEGLKSGQFGSDYETYLSDQFPFRDQWIGLKTTAEELQLKKEINGVWLGKDGWLMEALYEEDVDQALWEKNAGWLSQACGRWTSLLGEEHVRVLLAPSASEILTDKLPAFASPFSQKSVTDDLSRRGLDPILVPARDALLETAARDRSGGVSEQPALYYRTDHHWTSFGAYTAYVTWARSMGLSPYETKDFAVTTVTTEFLGTIHSKLNVPVTPDSIDLYRPLTEPAWNVYYDGSAEAVHSLYSMAALKTRDKYRVFLDGNHGLTKIENPDGPLQKRLLILKDSYAHSFAPFAALHFGETYLIDLRYYNGNIDDLIEAQGITDLLVLYEIPGFLKDKNISKLAS